MVAAAAQRYPQLCFRQGDLRALDVPEATFGGIVAFYSIVHLTPDELAPAFREWRRVLLPGGRALVAFHSGDQVLHLDTWWEKQVDLDFHFWQPATVTGALRAAGFTIEALVQRAPYPDVEHPSERAYVLAQRMETAA
jgi:SAM-dependent methyltransferase